MGPTPDASTQHLAERRWWAGAQRDDTRVARRLSLTHLGDGGYRLHEGALLEDFWPCLQAIGVMALLEEAHGAAILRQLVPCLHDVRRYGVKPLVGMESIKALPSLLCSAEALMPWVGFNAPQGRQGICQRGATTRQGERLPGPLGPDTLAKDMVKGNLRDLAAGCNGAIRALAQAGGVGQRVTGMADGTALETTER